MHNYDSLSEHIAKSIQPSKKLVSSLAVSLVRLVKACIAHIVVCYNNKLSTNPSLCMQYIETRRNMAVLIQDKSIVITAQSLM